MPQDDKWGFSSSGRHMFVIFSTVWQSVPGFIATIDYGNDINNIKICASKH